MPSVPGRRLLPAAVALLLAALSACSTGSPAADPTSLPPAADPGLGHVHGLGVDPADGVLYAATHYGLFRVPATGPASRVAARLQDTMGFTVVGPRTFLGSGHPDQQKDPQLPVRLGLIRSKDAAQTWQSLSLSGTVDFHALHAVGSAVYGWDSGSGALLASTDGGKTWDTRSTVALRDFAVSPNDPDLLLGTTEQGLLRSTDGGRNWRPARAAPQLALLAWPARQGLVGVGPDGDVSRSADGGATWKARGTVGGQPEALTVDPHSGWVYVAVGAGGVLVSTDGGATFRTRSAA